MSEIRDDEIVGTYSTEAKANIRERVIRMQHLIKHIERNGIHVSKKKLMALYCIKEGISKSTAYSYLEEYMDAELIVQYGDNIMTINQYVEKRSGDAERLQELADSV